MKLDDLRKCIIECRRCPRLVKFRENVPPRKDQDYWRRPLPGFGDPKASLLILGMAPSAEGGNRTGRIFTGDGSGRFLFQALYKEGFANQPTSESADDGLKLKDCYITAAVKCVPPQNKPEKQEFLNCSEYLWNEIDFLKKLAGVLALGKFAFDAYLHFVRKQGKDVSGLKFRHGEMFPFEGLPTLYASYHPSPQNTNTGKLTEAMFRSFLRKIRKEMAI